MPRILLLALLGLLALPAAAGAAMPRPGTLFEDHLHNTPNARDWHVQLQANEKGAGLTSVVLYAEQCEDSGLTAAVPVAADGSFKVDRKLNDGKGTWSVHGRFSDPDHAIGTWSMTKGGCVTGTHDFTAHDGHGHYFIGNPGGYPPERIRLATKNGRRLRNLKRATLLNASRWNTRAKAAAQGYAMESTHSCPNFIHARKNGVRMWGHVLDPTAPQALVFWCDGARNLTLAAAMYRAPPESHPPTYANMIQWHKHGAHGTWMMHVWLVPDVVSALAACAPFPAFESLGMFDYANYFSELPIDEPCPDTVKTAPGPAPAPAPTQ